jgi:hypothetical protein
MSEIEEPFNKNRYNQNKSLSIYARMIFNNFN